MKRIPKHPHLWPWTSLLLPGSLWIAYLTVSFTMAAYFCRGNLWYLHAFSLIALFITGVGIWGAIRSWHHFKGEGGKEILSLMALFINVLLFLTILASELSNHIPRPCP